MGQLSRTFKALTTQIRTNPSLNLPLTLSILDDVGVALDVIGRTTLAKETVDGIRREIGGLEREAKGVGGVGISDMIEDIKRRGAAINSLPSDGNIIDLTVEVHLILNPD